MVQEVSLPRVKDEGRFQDFHICSVLSKLTNFEFDEDNFVLFFDLKVEVLRAIIRGGYNAGIN